jgi:hypothetical protein
MLRVGPVLAGLSLSILGCQPPIETIEPTDVVSPSASSEPTPEQIIAASNLPPLVPVPLDGDAMGVTVHRLDNGLTVYISTDRQQPRSRTTSSTCCSRAPTTMER